MERKRIATEDGSHSFYVPELDEHYHSTHGAIQESRHVFINAGLKQCSRAQPLHILEIGFGTGLNALLTLTDDLHQNGLIYYDALEAYPLGSDEIADLNYTELLDIADMHPVFIKMHAVKWGSPISIHQGFQLNKIREPLEQFQPPIDRYHLVYFDAFAPTVQPKLWTEEIFRKIYSSMKSGGVLVTYCAKGSVKRALKASGFKLESLEGPKGKREMTRASK